MTHKTVGERLQAHFLDKRIKVSEVSRNAGIQYDTLQQIFSGKVKAMGVDKFAALWKAYPELDAWHVLTGELPKPQLISVDLTTVEQLKEFKTEMIQALDKRIQELGG